MIHVRRNAQVLKRGDIIVIQGEYHIVDKVDPPRKPRPATASASGASAGRATGGGAPSTGGGSGQGGGIPFYPWDVPGSAGWGAFVGGSAGSGSLHEGDWVRVKSGKYKGRTGKILGMSPQKVQLEFKNGEKMKGCHLFQSKVGQTS